MTSCPADKSDPTFFAEAVTRHVEALERELVALQTEATIAESYYQSERANRAISVKCSRDKFAHSFELWRP